MKAEGWICYGSKLTTILSLTTTADNIVKEPVVAPGLGFSRVEDPEHSIHSSSKHGWLMEIP